MTDRRGRALRVTEKASSPDTLSPSIVSVERPRAQAGEAVVEVLAAAVNVSDAKAALGLMPQTVWPRVPGRDFAGRVVEGPQAWVGAEVWGTGGDLGITRDGSHSRWLTLPIEALCLKSAAVSLDEAGTVGVPFVTAFEAFRRVDLKPGQSVAVFGASGKVGQAAVQLAKRAGAKVISVGRQHIANAEEMVIELTNGLGCDVAFNTVGSPYFQSALDSLAVGGTQILISTIERSVPFEILPFYRRNLQMIGIDSLKLTAVDCARILDQLRPGFDDGSLRAYPVDGALLGLEDAPDAYRRVLAGARSRVVLAP